MWPQNERDAVFKQLEPAIESAAKWMVRRYKVPHLLDDVAQEVRTTLLQMMQDGRLRPTDAESFVTRERSTNAYVIPETARNAARKLSGRRRSRQEIVFENIELTELQKPDTAKLRNLETEARDAFDSALERGYPDVTSQERAALVGKAEQNLNSLNARGDARSTAERKLLQRAKAKVKANPTPLLMRLIGRAFFAFTLLMSSGASQHVGGYNLVAVHQHRALEIRTLHQHGPLEIRGSPALATPSLLAVHQHRDLGGIQLHQHGSLDWSDIRLPTATHA